MNTDSYAISELAKEFGISTRTIRFYEEKGLLGPSRSPGNQRRYCRRDRTRLKLIMRGKRFGLALGEIQEILGFYDVDFDEKEQLYKALRYGSKYVQKVRGQIEDLILLESELSDLGEHILARLEAINEQSDELEEFRHMIGKRNNGRMS